MMGRVTFCSNAKCATTPVSNVFIDKYMAGANAAQLKIYIYLLRAMSAHLPTNVADLADKFNYTEQDVNRALKYWEKKGLASVEYDSKGEIVGVVLDDIKTSTASAKKAEKNQGSDLTTETSRDQASLQAADTASMKADLEAASQADPEAANQADPEAASQAESKDAEPAGKKPILVNGGKSDQPKSAMEAALSLASSLKAPEKPDYSPEDIDAFKTDESLKQIFFVAQQYMGGPISYTGTTTFLYIHDTLKFSDDLLDYLIQYCVERGNKSYRYMEAVARAWHENGITTVEQAKKRVSRYDENIYAIMKDLGLFNTPTETEAAIIEKWIKEYGLPMDVIQEACRRTTLTVSKSRIPYCDGILTKWHKAGVASREDIQTADSSYKESQKRSKKTPSGKKRQYANFKQNTYDFKKLEEELVER